MISKKSKTKEKEKTRGETLGLSRRDEGKEATGDVEKRN